MFKFALITFLFLAQDVCSQYLCGGAIPGGFAGHGTRIDCEPRYGCGYNGLGSGYDFSAREAIAGGSGVGELNVAGELPVVGTTLIGGQLPIIGFVEFVGEVPAAGFVNVVGDCDCFCKGRLLY